ncbi:hypothetical protein JIR001_26790 [Polycladomyces abyssicola]|uniref:Uncharacterized protein n=1 Tax=Polycladomyces abyssicola TaxID=1125966 RepID=A0A8D5UI52_9BACL|nr:hypothetical protein JIR001_26790 [Polycladomyces abyssicola]
MTIDQDYTLRITDDLLTGFHETGSKSLGSVIGFYPAGSFEPCLFGSGGTRIYVGMNLIV